MSSYFDNLSRAVHEAAQHESDESFLERVVQIEAGLYWDVTRITGDREFPDDLRERILGVLATKAVYQPGRLSMPEKARDWVLTVRSSRAIEDVHDLFHEVARRRVRTRFGLLSDSPKGDAERRDEHDEEEA